MKEKKIISLVLLSFHLVFFETQCNTPDKNSKEITTIQKPQNPVAPKPDSLSGQSNSELKTNEALDLKNIDSFPTTELSETCSRDTTVQLNDSINYSIIITGDKAGVCSYYFVASQHTKRKQVIATKLLHSDCDVDYSWDEYSLYGHSIVSKNKIAVIETTIFQKKDSTGSVIPESEDHKEIQKSYFTISQKGQISKLLH
jgi:hypothetical protein